MASEVPKDSSYPGEGGDNVLKSVYPIGGSLDAKEGVAPYLTITNNKREKFA